MSISAHKLGIALFLYEYTPDLCPSNLFDVIIEHYQAASDSSVDNFASMLVGSGMPQAPKSPVQHPGKDPKLVSRVDLVFWTPPYRGQVSSWLGFETD